MNFAIITIDSLRCDSLEISKTPILDEYLRTKDKKWHPVWAQGTYTLPSHIALFRDGHFPSDETSDYGRGYKRRGGFRWFAPKLPWNKRRDVMYPIPDNSPNIPKGFSMMGYNTVGIGGVGWFADSFKTSAFWQGEYFDDFFWNPFFREDHNNSFEHQIKKVKQLKRQGRLNAPLFFFLNISSTHIPCRGNKTVKGQADAMEYVDSHIMEVIKELPRPLHLWIMADHGTCLGDDGLVGHGFYHPKIMRVPLVSVENA